MPHPDISWALVVNRAARALLVVLAAALAVRLAARLIHRLERHALLKRTPSPRQTTWFRVVQSALRYTVDGIAAITVLSLVGLPTGSLLASAGLIGLVLTFGAQNLIQDVITGFFLLYEDQFAVGDTIYLPALNLTGTVRDLGIRITRLTDDTGAETMVPNRLIAEVQNRSRPGYRTTVPIVWPTSDDPAMVTERLHQWVNDMQSQIPGLTLDGITALDANQITWSLSAPASAETATKLREALALWIYGMRETRGDQN
jgi:small-conductance mechanosensitive channel